MSWWLLLIFVTVVWLAFAIMDGMLHNCSIVSGWVIFGWIFWALAMLVDFFASPWGTYIVAAIHGLLSLMIALAMTVMFWHRKR